MPRGTSNKWIKYGLSIFIKQKDLFEFYNQSAFTPDIRQAAANTARQAYIAKQMLTVKPATAQAVLSAYGVPYNPDDMQENLLKLIWLIGRDMCDEKTYKYFTEYGKPGYKDEYISRKGKNFDFLKTDEI